MKIKHLSVLILAGLVTSAVLADGGFVLPEPPRKEELKGEVMSAYLDEPEQQAIIVFDGSRETLHLQARYEGNIEDFGWIIPAPSRPEVGRGTKGLFEEIAEYFYRLRLEEWKAGRLEGEGGVISLGEEGGAKQKAAKPEKVKVVESKRVGVYDLTVLAATDAEALGEWLEKNKFVIPQTDEAREILDYYVKRKMYFCTLRVNRGSRRISSRTAEGWIHPVTITFSTDRPFYPLRISALHTRETKNSKILIHLFSTPDMLSLTGVSRISRNGFWQHEYGFEHKDLPKCFKAFPELEKRRHILTTIEGRAGLHDMYSDIWLATQESELDAPKARALWAQASRGVDSMLVHALCREIMADHPCTPEAAGAYEKIKSLGEKVESLDEADAQRRTLRGHEMAAGNRFREAKAQFEQIARMYPWHADEAASNMKKAHESEGLFLSNLWNTIQEQKESGQKENDYKDYYRNLVALMLVCSDLHDSWNLSDEKLKRIYYNAGLTEVEWVNRTYGPLMDRKFDVTRREIEWQEKRNPALAHEMCRKIRAIHPGTRYAEKARDLMNEMKD